MSEAYIVTNVFRAEEPEEEAVGEGGDAAGGSERQPKAAEDLVVASFEREVFESTQLWVVLFTGKP